MNDPVRARRARIARWADVGQKAGYTLFALAVVAFVSALVAGLSSTWVAIVVIALVLGSVVLAPSIVIGFAARAAEREDREDGASSSTGSRSGRPRPLPWRGRRR